MSVTERSYGFPAIAMPWGVLISTLGVVFGVVELAHLRAMSSPFGILLEAVVPLLGALGLVGAGYALQRERFVYEAVDASRIAGWTVAGSLGMGVIFLWIFAHQLIRGGTFHHAHFILVNNCIAGALIGFLVGTYDARSRVYRRSIRRERLKHDFLNRELRHHILNGMQVILRQFDRLENVADPTVEDAVTTGRERGEEIVTRVQSVRTISRVFTEEGEVTLSRQNLSNVVTDAVEGAEARYENAVVTADVPDDIVVSADEYVSAIFENLLANAIEHNDKETPRVRVALTVDAETAVVRIADNGPGMSDDHKDALFGWEEPSRANIGMGVGLAIVTALVDRYDGRIWVEDNTPTGTTVYVELSRTG